MKWISWRHRFHFIISLSIHHHCIIIASSFHNKDSSFYHQFIINSSFLYVGHRFLYIFPVSFSDPNQVPASCRESLDTAAEISSFLGVSWPSKLSRPTNNPRNQSSKLSKPPKMGGKTFRMPPPKNKWFCTLHFYPRFFWEGNSTGERLFWPCTWAVSHQVYPRGFSSIALAELQRFMAPRWVWEKFHVQNAGDEQSRWFCKWRQWEMFCKENGISWQGTTLSCYDFKTFCVSRYSVECLEEWMFREPTAKSQVSAIAPAALRRVLQCLGTCWGLLHFGICIVLLIVVSTPFHHHHYYHYHHPLGGLL